MTDRIVTCIQEKLDNSIITVRLDGKLLGRVLQDRPHEWVLLPEEQPRSPRFESLQDAVAALIEQSVADQT